MSDKPNNPGRRRRFQVDGELPETTEAKQPEVRSVEEMLGFERPDEEPAEGEEMPPVYAEVRVQQFMEGRITLGDLEGITKQEQYEIAKLGHSYLSGGKLDEAKSVFEGLLALDPFDAYFRMALASVAQQKGELEEAEKGYTRVLEINPFSPTAYANRGEVRVMLGQLAAGAEDLIRAVSEDPDSKEPATQRARATLQVLKDQLGAMEGELAARAEEATDSKVRAASQAVAQGGPRGRSGPRAGPRGRPPPQAKPRPRRPGPRKKS